MAEKRLFMYFDPTLNRYRRAGANDVLGNIVGTDLTLGEAVAQFDLVYIKPADSKAWLAKADDDTTVEVAYMVLEAGIADDVVQAAADGQTIPGLSALSPGARYFLSAATAGAKSTTAPSTTDQHVASVGVAKSATELEFRFEHIIKL